MTMLGRLEARERRLAALHEAGHAVLARELGMHGISAEIWRAREPGLDRPSWVGRMLFLDLPRRDDAAVRRLIGVAGLVAVELHLGGSPAVLGAGLADLSPSDLAIAGVYRDADGEITAADRHQLVAACAAAAAILCRPSVRDLLMTTARRLILEATGRYDGALFAAAATRPRELA